MEAEFTDRGLQCLALQDVSAQYVLWNWRDKIFIFLCGRTPNLQCQRDLPDLNQLPLETINGAERPRKFLKFTRY